MNIIKSNSKSISVNYCNERLYSNMYDIPFKVSESFREIWVRSICHHGLPIFFLVWNIREHKSMQKVELNDHCYEGWLTSGGDFFHHTCSNVECKIFLLTLMMLFWPLFVTKHNFSRIIFTLCVKKIHFYWDIFSIDNSL